MVQLRDPFIIVHEILLTGEYMKKRVVFVVLAFAISLCACNGRVSFSTIAARDAITGAELVLEIPAEYSPGDYASSGGCSFSSKLSFDEMIGIVEETEHVSKVEITTYFEPIKQAGIYVCSPSGIYSVFYLNDSRFYSMGAMLKESVYDQSGIDFLFPFHLIADQRISVPHTNSFFDGVEYACILSDNSVENRFEVFYREIAHYPLSTNPDGFSLVVGNRSICFRFTTHADQVFVAMTVLPL